MRCGQPSRRGVNRLLGRQALIDRYGLPGKDGKVLIGLSAAVTFARTECRRSGRRFSYGGGGRMAQSQAIYRHGDWGADGLIAATALRPLTLDDVKVEESACPVFVDAEQIHGNGIAVIGRTENSLTMKGADALVTNSRGIALSVRTADCLPVLFQDSRRHVISAVHAGWRGLALSILSRTLIAFRHHYQVPAEEVRALIGPSVRGCCYEVGPTFPSLFDSYKQRREGADFCDLIAFAKDQLIDAGMLAENISDVGICTVCSPGHWSSVRRDGAEVARMISYIAQP